MPTVVNGCGTWYYGKDNAHAHLDTCDSCGAYTRLVSYDTRGYLCAIYLPLVPLGRKRVSDECPHCKKHRVTPLRKWNQLKSEQATEAIDAYTAHPLDMGKAQQAVAATIFFENEDAFLGISKQVEQQHATRSEILAALAHGYAFFGYPDGAVTIFQKMLAIEDAPAVRELLALLYAHMKQPQQAEAHVQHLLDQKSANRVGLLYIIAATYLELGQNNEAMQLINRTAAAMPDAVDDRDWKKLRKQAEASKGRKISVLPNIEQQEESRPWIGKVAPIVGPAILMLAVLGYLAIAWSAGQRTVHLVNGLKRAYTVSINGETIKLPANGWRKHQITEGTLTVTVHDSDLGIADATLHIETPMLMRPFINAAFVINPDRVAILVEETIVYGNATLSEDENIYRMHGGELLYRFDALDYVLEPFPKSLQLSSNADGAIRHRVGRPSSDLTSYQQIAIFREQMGPDAVAEMLQRRLMYDPEQTEDMELLGSFLPLDEYEQLLRSRLPDRPVRMEWHRVYQTLAQRQQPTDQLVAEYRKLLEAEPNDHVLMYLLGRLLEDPQEAEAMFMRSVEPPQPCSYSYNALAYSRLVRGDYEQALIFSEQAVALHDSKTFQLVRTEALHGSGQFDPLLNTTSNPPKPPSDLDAAEWRLYLLCRLNRVVEAQEELEQYSALLRNMGMDLDAMGQWHQRQQALLLYYQDKSSAFAGLVDEQEAIDLLFSAALIEQRWADAAAVIEREKQPDGYTALLLYALAELNGDHELAEESLASSLELWQVEAWWMNGAEQLAQWITDGSPPDDAQVRHLQTRPSEKRIAMLALGVRFPQHRQQYWQLAKQLNYDKRLPYLSIQQALSQD